jgi:hypothetical protein
LYIGQTIAFPSSTQQAAGKATNGAGCSLDLQQQQQQQQKQ